MKIAKKIFLVIFLLTVLDLAVQAQQPCPGPDLVATQPKITRLIIGGKGYLEASAYIINMGTEPFLRPIRVELLMKKKWMSGSGRDSYEFFSGYKVSRVDVNQRIHLLGRCELPGFDKWDCRTLLIMPECCREVQVIVRVDFLNPVDKDCRLDNNQCPDLPENHVKYTAKCPR